MANDFVNIRKWLPELPIREMRSPTLYEERDISMWYVNAADLERILADAPRVYGEKERPDILWGLGSPCDEDTHESSLTILRELKAI
jgi:hypothetical protein